MACFDIGEYRYSHIAKAFVRYSGCCGIEQRSYLLVKNTKKGGI